ncbi:MAG: hypothetical protein ABI863_18445 [Ginsengibacter sp.]
MKTIFIPNFNWPVFFLVACILRLSFIDLSWAGYIVILLSLYQFALLFASMGHFIPIRYLLGSFMCIQFFIGPALAYNGLDKYQYFLYRMQIPEMEYFSYAIPAVLAFIAGLHLFAGNLDGEVADEKRIRLFVQNNPKLPYAFIIIGFFISILSSFFSSDLAFVFYLLGNFKFIGLFLLILGSKQLKVLPLVVVMGSIISSSLGEGMFHDLLTWIIFTGAIFAIKYKIKFRTKLIGASAFIFLALTIQLLKNNYRTAISNGGAEGGIETFTNLYETENKNNSLFSFEKIAKSNVRINQGFIITNIMKTIPGKQPFSDGEEMYEIFEAAILPRILAPDKLKAGDQAIFFKYSGIRLTEGTSMGLSSLGDAYINFGVIGGCLFMFFLGLLYGGVLNLFKKNSSKYPVLILFTALVFYYPIRPDCELQTILGHVFKSVFLIYAMISGWKSTFFVPSKFVIKDNDFSRKVLLN